LNKALFRKLNINESFISKIWEGWRKNYSNLLTSEGDIVEVIDIGVRNYDSGPDFTNSRVKIGNKTYSGDVEIHRDFSGWEEHNHLKDSRYNSVILQVVMWDSPERTEPKLRKKRKLPTVILSRFLTRSIHEIWQEIIENPSDKFKLPCYEVNRNVSRETIVDFLEKLSFERLNLKCRRIKQRLSELSGEIYNRSSPQIIRDADLWKQAFYEFTFEALGFSKNKETMLKLTKSFRLKLIKQILDNTKGDRLLFTQALLFGSAGFLFDIRTKSEYTDNLRQIWNEVKDKLKIERLNCSEWKFFRMRPSNFPTLRLAYGSQIILRLLYEDLFKGIVLNFQADDFKVGDCYNNLKSLLEPYDDYYWSKNYFFSRQSKRTYQLLGEERLNDIIINVIIPFVYLYSVTFKNSDITKNVLNFYSDLKIKADNSVVKVIKTQLLNHTRIKINSPAIEQAAMQLYNFYCTRERCEMCEIGKSVYKEKAYEYKIIFY
jgi:hypothetical protein